MVEDTIGQYKYFLSGVEKGRAKQGVKNSLEKYMDTGLVLILLVKKL